LIEAEIKKFIGRAGRQLTMEVEKGPIRRFADAVADPNPLYRDEEYARKSRYGAIIAPPGFYGWPIQGGDLRAGLDIRKEITNFLTDRGYQRLIEKDIEFEFMLPVYAGDRLIALPRIADVHYRQGKTGGRFSIVIEIDFTKQKAQPVARMRQTLVIY